MGLGSLAGIPSPEAPSVADAPAAEDAAEELLGLFGLRVTATTAISGFLATGDS